MTLEERSLGVESKWREEYRAELEKARADNMKLCNLVFRMSQQLTEAAAVIEELMRKLYDERSET